MKKSDFDPSKVQDYKETCKQILRTEGCFNNIYIACIRCPMFDKPELSCCDCVNSAKKFIKLFGGKYAK